MTPGIEGTSWAAVDLGPVIRGEEVENRPTMLTRSDGPCLLYPGALHSLYGEPEAGKGWLALQACAEELAAGAHVLYVDFEDRARTQVTRLAALGVEEAVLFERFHYVRPVDAMGEAGLASVRALLLEFSPSLAVLDGITEAFGLHALSISDNDDVTRWRRMLPHKLMEAGAAVLEIDHVTKDREGRGRYAIGAQHKLSGADVALAVQVVTPFGRGREGLMKLTVEKDRHGFLREHQEGGKRIADFHLASLPDGSVTASLQPPDASSAVFRPTGIMEQVSRLVESTPGIGVRQIREGVNGKNKHIDHAIGVLLSEGFLARKEDGKAMRHTSLKPFREGDEELCAPCAPMCPEPSGAHVEGYVPRAPTPLGGTGTQPDPEGWDFDDLDADRAPLGAVGAERSEMSPAAPLAERLGMRFPRRIECAYPERHQEFHTTRADGAAVCDRCHPQVVAS